jgi:hypothetical protein
MSRDIDRAGERSAPPIVFTLAFSTLMLELVISRMSPFYLNYGNAFLAIPLTLFGLALGSLRVHLSRRSIEQFKVPSDLLVLTIVSFLSFAAAFFLFSRFFPISNRNTLGGAMTVIKTLMFVLIFLPPFFYVGKILTIMYATYRAMIGKLYGMDFAGGALACFFTPVLFHFVDLPYIISICLVALTLVTALAFGVSRRSAPLAVFVVLIGALLPALTCLESRYDMQQALSGSRKVTELAHRWNEFSRVSLLRVENSRDNSPDYRIIHDNAESNVHVVPYRTGAQSTISDTSDIRVPFLLGRKTDEIMVMFAGCGAQMIEFHELGGGKLRLVGVEINPLVVDFAVSHPELADYRIGEFYALPNVEMVVAEGRAFLDQDSSAYDVIYVGSNAATAKYKTGHSRKYLDTVEAIEAYYDHLKPDGLIIFHSQPNFNKLTSLNKIFKDRELGDLFPHIFMYSKRLDYSDFTFFSKRPFAPEEIGILVGKYRGGKIRFAPGYGKNDSKVTELIAKGFESGISKMVTDDRPFVQTLDFEGFELFSSLKKFKQRFYYAGWIMITTLILVSLVVAGLLVMLYPIRSEKPPANMVIYLLVTGACYMLVQISYISKLELFLGNPLYSMALLLSVFLITNALGSMAYNRLRDRLNMSWAPMVAAVITLLSAAAIDAVIERRLGLNLPMKALLSIAMISPVGLCLGVFYPYVVTWLTQKGLVKSVPITYGISTLSSVWGATYAMTMIVNLGYNKMIYQAAVAYSALTLLMLIYNRLVKAS